MTAVVTAVSVGLELLLGEGMVWAWWRSHPANLLLLQLLHTLRCAHTRACAPLPCVPQMAGRGASQPDVFFIAPKPGITKHLHLLPIRGETDCSFMDCVCLGVFLFVTPSNQQSLSGGRHPWGHLPAARGPQRWWHGVWDPQLCVHGSPLAPLTCWEEN